MKRSYTLVLALMWGCRGNEKTVTAKPPRFPVTIATDHIALVSGSVGRELMRQCSREVPPGLSNSWQATPADLSGLDSLLPNLVQKKLADAFPVGSPFDHRKGSYYAQVAGLVRGRDRLLYINGFDASTLNDFQDSTEWRRRSIVVCDGGPGYFGVLFNPSTRRFSDFHFNGPG